MYMSCKVLKTYFKNLFAECVLLEILHFNNPSKCRFSSVGAYIRVLRIEKSSDLIECGYTDSSKNAFSDLPFRIEAFNVEVFFAKINFWV